MLQVCGIVKRQIRARRVGHVAGVWYRKKRSEPGGLGMLQVCGIEKDRPEPGGLGMLQVCGIV